MPDIKEEFDPNSGGMVPLQIDPPKPPNRSWRRGGMNGAFDFKFDYEGSTVLSRYAPDLAWVDAQQKTLTTMAQEIQAQQEVLEKMVADKADADEIEAFGEALNAKGIAITKFTNDFAQSLVTQTVVGWSKAPLPYSEENRDNLPFDILKDWLPEIANNSRLSEGEKGFLGTKSG